MFMVIIIILIAIIVYVIYQKGGFEAVVGKTETPLDVLQKRFANGEISSEEYEEKKKILEDK